MCLFVAALIAILVVIIILVVTVWFIFNISFQYFIFIISYKWHNIPLTSTQVYYNPQDVRYSMGNLYQPHFQIINYFKVRQVFTRLHQSYEILFYFFTPSTIKIFIGQLIVSLVIIFVVIAVDHLLTWSLINHNVLGLTS